MKIIEWETQNDYKIKENNSKQSNIKIKSILSLTNYTGSDISRGGIVTVNHLIVLRNSKR